MSLPYLQHLNDFVPLKAIEFMRDDLAREHYYAISMGFGETEDGDLCHLIYPEYLNYFNEKIKQLTDFFNEEPILTSWYDADFPEWAVGDHIAYWKNQRVYLKIHHEDQEFPITVALSEAVF